MGVIFRNGRFGFDHGQTSVKKSTESLVLRKLRAFLDATEPSLVRLLVNTWQTQGKAITYKELREAILAGDITIEMIEDWQQDYVRFVTKYMQPAWEMAIATAAGEIARKYPEWNFDPMGEGVKTWVQNRGAAFVTNSTQAQIDGLRAVVQRAAVLEDLNVDQLARSVRAMVGLTQQQTVANLNYYNNLIKNGASEKRALDLSIRYSARQHRYRGYNIARTELAFAYNQGSYEGTKQAQAAGYMGQVVKVWNTALDERTCDACGSLEGKEIAMDDDFYYEVKDRSGNTIQRRINPKLTDQVTGRVPPAHPSCRCAVEYREIAPPAAP